MDNMVANSVISILSFFLDNETDIKIFITKSIYSLY